MFTLRKTINLSPEGTTTGGGSAAADNTDILSALSDADDLLDDDDSDDEATKAAKAAANKSSDNDSKTETTTKTEVGKTSTDKGEGKKETTGVTDDNEVTEIKLGDKTFKLDENGNVLGDDGKIVLTKEQVEKGEVGDDTDDGESKSAKIDNLEVKDIIGQIGFEIKDEEGKVKTYSNDRSGIVNYTRDLAAHFLAESQEQFLDSVPGLRNYAIAMQLPGMTPEKYFNLYVKEDVLTTAIDDNTAEDILKGIVIKDLVNKGVDVDAAKSVAEAAKINGNLKEKAIAAQTSMKTFKEANEAKAKQDYDNYIREQRKEAEDHTKNLINTINSGKIGDIIVREVDKKAFIDYLLKPVSKDGDTQEILDLKKETPEQRLIKSYHRFKNYLDGDGVNAKNKSEKQKEITQKYSKAISAFLTKSQNDGKAKGKSKKGSSTGTGASGGGTIDDFRSVMDEEYM